MRGRWAVSELGEFKKCGTCGKYAFVGTHRCPPVWIVYECLDDHPDLVYERRIYAQDMEEAAAEFGVHWDAGDYTLLDGDELKVMVLSSDRSQQCRFVVSGRTEPVYTARNAARQDKEDYDG